MSKKSQNDRRQHILDVAAHVFREMGFHNASMNVIAQRVGGSKTTLYKYFPSKEAIFLEIARDLASMQNGVIDRPIYMLTEESSSRVNDVFRELEKSSDDVAATLQRFGEKFLAFLYSPELLEIRRLLIAESRQPEVARIYYENGPKRMLFRLSFFLGNAIAAGQIKATDPAIAAAQLRSLLEAECLEYYLLGLDNPIPEERIRKMVASAVKVFMAAYGK